MEFVSADRSRDAEFTRGLQQYNRNVMENNKTIAAQVDKTKDDLDEALDNAQQVADLANMKVQGALGGIVAGSGEKGVRAVKAGKEAAAARKAAKLLAARGGGVEVPVSAAEELAGPGGRFGPGEQLLGDPGAESAALESFEEEGSGISRVYRGGARPPSPTRLRPEPEFSEQEQREFRSAVEERGAEREGATAGEEGAGRVAAKAGEKAGEEATELTAGKVVGKLAGGLARGAGIAGAAVSAGTAIEGLVSGEKFEWNKQGAELGGALLDILGTGAEFIPGGQLIGVGLQIAGTALSGYGTFEEGLSVEPKQEEEEQTAKDLQAKTQADLESQKQQALSRVTQAAAGGAAVGREQQ